jgi:hypothetical protein
MTPATFRPPASDKAAYDLIRAYRYYHQHDGPVVRFTDPVQEQFATPRPAATAPEHSTRPIHEVWDTGREAIYNQAAYKLFGIRMAGEEEAQEFIFTMYGPMVVTCSG